MVLCELLGRIAVRYYSISSSSIEQPNKISLTAVVVRYAHVQKSIKTGAESIVIKEGLTTSWVQRLHEKKNIVYPSMLEEGVMPHMYLPVYIRISHFKLPMDASVPVIMVGPGSGVAPFRGFIRERFMKAIRGEKVGLTWLFFGCRNEENVS